MLAGDVEAFRSIIEVYQPYLYRMAFSVLKHPKDAEDAIQEAFVKAFFSIPSFQGQGFRTWLTRITVNTAIDHKRKLGARKEALACTHDEVEDTFLLGHAIAQESVEDDLMRKERAQLIAHYLNDLPDSYRPVVIAFYMEEKSHLQIASEYGIAVKTVESKLYRARSWMKKHWKEDDF